MKNSVQESLFLATSIFFVTWCLCGRNVLILDYSPLRLPVKLRNGAGRDPVGYKIIPRGDTEINENQYGMRCIPEIVSKTSAVT